MTAQEYQALAVEQTGGTQTNAIFSFAFVRDTSDGTFKIGFGGLQTVEIPFAASVEEIRDALTAIALVGAGGVKVSGKRGRQIELEMVGPNAGQAFDAPFVDGSNLDPVQEVQVEIQQTGETNDFDSRVSTIWDDIEGAVNLKHRFLLTKLELIDIRLGNMVNSVDHKTGQLNVVERKSSQAYSNLLRLREITIGAANTIAIQNATISSRGFGGKIQKVTPNGLPYGVIGDPPGWRR